MMRHPFTQSSSKGERRVPQALKSLSAQRGLFVCISLLAITDSRSARGSELILAYPGAGGTSTIILAAQKWGFFPRTTQHANGSHEIKHRQCRVMAGEMSYSPASGPPASALLERVRRGAVWVPVIDSHRAGRHPIFKNSLNCVKEDRRRRLGGTNHVSLVMALEKNPV